ncbi:hypothetical protein ACHHYP_07629 [Achlya hypogyna]|uniref:Uncharacterized protein n=1 Tax=Achlya hypogyna TaxID=1202772 RepID=A0A1V9YQL0_ACHHY|nr:hypothetical protein ACHHYP_07629 [Achlya hypogyna]
MAAVRSTSWSLVEEEEDDDELREAFLTPATAAAPARPRNPVVVLLEATQSPRPVEFNDALQLKKRKVQDDVLVKPVPKRVHPQQPSWRPALPAEIDQEPPPACGSPLPTKFSRLALAGDRP